MGSKPASCTPLWPLHQLPLGPCPAWVPALTFFYVKLFPPHVAFGHAVLGQGQKPQLRQGCIFHWWHLYFILCARAFYMHVCLWHLVISRDAGSPRTGSTEHPVLSFTFWSSGLSQCSQPRAISAASPLKICFRFRIFILQNAWVFCSHVCIPCVPLVPTEVRRGSQIHWD